MRPAPDIMVAEEELIHTRRLHKSCGTTCTCTLLRAAGAFYTTVSARMTAKRLEEVRDLLLTNWVDVAVAYDAGQDIGDQVFRMYSTAVTYRLLAL